MRKVLVSGAGGTREFNLFKIKILKYILIILFLILMLIFDICLLWKPRSTDVEGDVLIHLVFARNFSKAETFVYGNNQKSNASSSPLWSILLSIFGKITKKIDSNEGFLLLARIISIIFLLIALLILYVSLRILNINKLLSIFSLGIIFFHPITFYWCVANPMETSLVLLFISLLIIFLIMMDVSNYNSIKNGIIFSILSLISFTIRPELIFICGISAIFFIFKNSKFNKDFFLAFSITTAFLSFIYLYIFLKAGLSPLSNAGFSRRAYLQYYDALQIPVLNIYLSLDAIILVLLVLPLLIGDYISINKNVTNIYSKISLLWIIFYTLLFTFYYYSTWRGRYLLPVIIGIVPAGLVGIEMLFKKSPPMKYLLYIWLMFIIVIPLYPLAAHSKAYEARKQKNPESIYWDVPDIHLKIMVQEVQSAYYYPNLEFISTDGLIDMSAYYAMKNNLTVYEFILEKRPDIIGLGRFYLQDPDNLQAKLFENANNKSSFKIKNLFLDYLGIIKGSGPVFKVYYE